MWNGAEMFLQTVHSFSSKGWLSYFETWFHLGNELSSSNFFLILWIITHTKIKKIWDQSASATYTRCILFKKISDSLIKQARQLQFQKLYTAILGRRFQSRGRHQVVDFLNIIVPKTTKFYGTKIVHYIFDMYWLWNCLVSLH